MNTALPTTDKIIPYLERIDHNRVYANFGPLNEEYEKRLSKLFQAPVVTASSATSALTATLIALNLPPKSLIAVPSFTFIATPASIVMAGHVPYFCDVAKDGIINFIPADAKAAVIVAPCGSPLPDFKFDIPIIIDAAGGFDSFSRISTSRKYPTIISTHASKPFGTGEGGFIVHHDKVFLNKARQITNFGRDGVKINLPGFNAKLSEYHAAVGLAELDGWEDKRDRFLRRTKIYGLDYATSLVAVRDGIGKKLIYGCHMHKAYKDYPRTDLTNTEDLMKKISFVRVEI